MIIPSDVAERNRNRYLKTPGQKKNAEERSLWEVDLWSAVSRK
jgi:hypothetical protein